jgi:hypothetical protein
VSLDPTLLGSYKEAKHSVSLIPFTRVLAVPCSSNHQYFQANIFTEHTLSQRRVIGEQPIHREDVPLQEVSLSTHFFGKRSRFMISYHIISFKAISYTASRQNARPQVRTHTLHNNQDIARRRQRQYNLNDTIKHLRCRQAPNMNPAPDAVECPFNSLCSSKEVNHSNTNVNPR